MRDFTINNNNLDKVYTCAYDEIKVNGTYFSYLSLISEKQLKDKHLWELLVKQFAIKPDADDLGWRGEFWGKLMMGATEIFAVNNDIELYNILECSVKSLLKQSGNNGEISTYKKSQFDGWDLWCRKYVILGLEYFYFICKSEDVKKQIISSISMQMQIILNNIGNGENKIKITDSSCYKELLGGINSSSILEAVVLAYTLTKEEKLLDFAKYIVNEGGTLQGNIFEIALKSDLYPFEYPVTKAYEMISCFEGIVQLYKITGEEKYRQMAVNFGNKLIESELTIIGSAGCRHEYFDNSAKTQFKIQKRQMQETCVTVSILRYFYKLYALTGDVSYIEVIEKSFYNAYLGALKYKTDKNDRFIFDSYSPLIEDCRGNGVGGYKNLNEDDFYGCCVSYGPSGISIIPKLTCCEKDGDLIFNFYIKSKLVLNNNGINFGIDIDGEYPYCNDKIMISVKTDKPVKKKIYFRNPSWSNATSILVDGEKFSVLESGYFVVDKIWSNTETILLNFNDMPKINFLDNIAFISKGPIILSKDKRNNGTKSVSIDALKHLENKIIKSNKAKCIKNLEYSIEGYDITLIDYANAGKTFDERSTLSVKIN